MRTRGLTFTSKVSSTHKRMSSAPEWFELRASQYVRKPYPVATRMLVEDEQGKRYAKKAVTDKTLAELRNILPMGVSAVMPVYLMFIKAVNLKCYSVYACYNDTLRYPLFYVYDISDLGRLFTGKGKDK